jgi:hypothetical protein
VCCKTLLDRGWGTSFKWDRPFLQSFKKHQLNMANQTCLTFSVSKNCLNSESSLKAGWVAVLLRYLRGNVAQQKLNHSLAMYPNAPYFIILLSLELIRYIAIICVTLIPLTESLKKSFTYRRSVLWNNLPIEAINTTSVATFKNILRQSSWYYYS